MHHLTGAETTDACEAQWTKQLSPQGRLFWLHNVLLDTTWADPCVTNSNRARAIPRDPQSLLSTVQQYYDETTELYQTSVGDTLQAVEAVLPLSASYSMAGVQCGRTESALCRSNMHNFRFSELVREDAVDTLNPVVCAVSTGESPKGPRSEPRMPAGREPCRKTCSRLAQF